MWSTSYEQIFFFFTPSSNNPPMLSYKDNDPGLFLFSTLSSFLCFYTPQKEEFLRNVPSLIVEFLPISLSLSPIRDRANLSKSKSRTDHFFSVLLMLVNSRSSFFYFDIVIRDGRVP